MDFIDCFMVCFSDELIGVFSTTMTELRIGPGTKTIYPVSLHLLPLKGCALLNVNSPVVNFTDRDHQLSVSMTGYTVGILYFPGHRNIVEGTRAFLKDTINVGRMKSPKLYEIAASELKTCSQSTGLVIERTVV